MVRRFSLLALALLPAACGTLAPPPDPAWLPRPVGVALIDRDWHTEIYLDAGLATGPLGFLRDRFPGAQGFAIGFGDRHYLAAAHPGLGDLLLATLPAPGALLVTGLAAPPEAAFGAENVVRLRLSRAGAARLQAFLAGSFEHAPGRPPVPLRDGPYAGSLFYASPVTYALDHTCNTWTAEALQQGGAAVSAAGVVLAGQVMVRARDAERLGASASPPAGPGRSPDDLAVAGSPAPLSP